MVETDLFLPMIAGTIFYSLLNLGIRSRLKIPPSLEKKDKFDFIGQHISLIHSVEAIVMCIFSYTYSKGIDYYGETDYIQVVTLAFSLGYFTYDVIYAEIYGVHDWPMRIHHIFVLAGGICLLLQTRGGAIGPICLFLTELSNPFMQVRLILKGRRMENTRFYKLNEMIFGLVFITNRGGFGTLVNYNVHQYALPWLLKCMVSGVYGVSLYWIFLILNMLGKELKNKKSPSWVEQYFLSFMNSVKANQVLLVCGIITWSLFLPITLCSLGFGPLHIIYKGFQLV
ncbi:hypothetical protein SteCoe_9918 [Stentor coeruleus]|uniref:TLC domain-containing protein n=1 Tax=Stentor coeruleus TaxID=5963 RepID=A0A1R2CGT7_9CILI|nr:hypothetical protein SteCoe_9918 [Stentor coeruleus]